MTDTHRKLLLIGLDAADADLVERWTDDGTLPNLARIRRAGTWGRLSSAARYLTGSPWPTFYTGRPPSDHGIYHDFQWRQERMEFAAPATDWLPVRPFWRAIEGDIQTVVHDVPMTPGTEPFHGVEVTGWGSHDKLVPPDSYPPELLAEIRRRYGDSPIRTDEYGRASISHLRELHAELIGLTERSTALAGWLLQRPWNLGIVVFGALHRGGHRFWDRSSVDGDLPKALEPWYDSALRELYRAADKAVGELVQATPSATVFIFALHGMKVNTARVDFLDQMLSRVLHGPEASQTKSGLLRRLGEAMPLPLRRALTNSVPQALKNRIMTRWTTGGMKWDQTQAFTLRADLNGYIRLNMRGREPAGVVPPEAADALCARIDEGLRSFRDAETGQPLIEEVCRATEVFPPGDRMHRLPDLVIRWHPDSGAPHKAIVSSTLGHITRATPGRIPNGRSGNHAPHGFLMAHGPNIAAGARLEAGADILDIAPTALHHLNVGSRVPLAGKVLTQLV
ncbi:MAG TPA: alkaline phosphatase family protein [Gemmatimonadales bacterium]|nr:alkaline phosphatase family protein [Gemmatimonadales bacterium]